MSVISQTCAQWQGQPNMSNQTREHTVDFWVCWWQYAMIIIRMTRSMKSLQFILVGNTILYYSGPAWWRTFTQVCMPALRHGPSIFNWLTFICSFRSRLPRGPVGPDLPPSQPLTSHLLYGVLCVLIGQRKHKKLLSHRHQTQNISV